MISQCSQIPRLLKSFPEYFFSFSRTIFVHEILDTFTTTKLFLYLLHIAWASCYQFVSWSYTSSIFSKDIRLLSKWQLSLNPSQNQRVVTVFQDNVYIPGFSRFSRMVTMNDVSHTIIQLHICMHKYYVLPYWKWVEISDKSLMFWNVTYMKEI